MMDETDIKILEMLQKNARSTASEIGATIGMSVSAVIERIKKLENNGVIEEYTTILNHKNVKKDVTAFVNISLEHPKYNDQFLQFVQSCGDILECHYLAGDFDYLLKVITDSTTTLEQLLRSIKCTAGVVRTYTSLVLTTEKCAHSVPPSGITGALRT